MQAKKGIDSMQHTGLWTRLSMHGTGTNVLVGSESITPDAAAFQSMWYTDDWTGAIGAKCFVFVRP